MKKIVVMGDSLVSSKTLIDAAKTIYKDVEVKAFDWHANLSKDQFQAHIKDIELHGPEEQFIPTGIIEALKEADVFLLHYGPVSKMMIESMKKGTLVGLCRGGVENVNVEACRNKDIRVIHCIRNAEPVAEFTIGLMLAQTRNIVRSNWSILNGKWQKDFSNNEFKTTISGKTIGLVGLGSIGRLVVKQLKGFDCNIIVYDPYVKPSKDNKNFQLVDLETLLKESDIVSLHARVTEETKDMISFEEINTMKKSAYIINTARPGLLNKEALLDALKEKRIAGAALDVMWEEPIDKNDAILKLDNITLTTHIAGDTVDAITMSPFLLAKEIIAYETMGKKEMIVV